MDIMNSSQRPDPVFGNSLLAIWKQQIIAEHALKMKALREVIKALKAKTEFYVLLTQQVLKDPHVRNTASALPTFLI